MAHPEQLRMGWGADCFSKRPCELDGGQASGAIHADLFPAQKTPAHH